MYVTPRPLYEDDPWFAVRLAAGGVLALLAAVAVQSPMPMIPPALTIGIMGGMRKAFNAKKALGGPIAMALIVMALGFVVELLRPVPAALILAIGLIYALAYVLILRSGNPIGMLILIATALMSIMGMNSVRGMAVLRDAFVEGAAVAMLIIPLLYALLPPAARETEIETYSPSAGGRFLARGLIRGGVLLLLTLWLYTVVDESNLMLVLAGVFVMVFPTREQLFAEARERTYATVLGGAFALVIVALFAASAHLANLMMLVFLGGLALADRMIRGRHPPMVYQFAFSVMIALVGSALTSKAPMDAALLRIVLTLVGAVAAAFLTSLLEALFVAPTPRSA